MDNYKSFSQGNLPGTVARHHFTRPDLLQGQGLLVQLIRKAPYYFALFALCFTASFTFADDSALIDALVRKGILNQKEAESIEAEVNREASEASAAKVRSSKWGVEDWRLAQRVGPLRRLAPPKLLPEHASATSWPSNSARFDNQTQRDRWRFRLRLNADFKLAENFFGGRSAQYFGQS